LDLTSVEEVGQIPVIPILRKVEVKRYNLSFELLWLDYRQYDPIHAQAFRRLYLGDRNKLTILDRSVISRLTRDIRPLNTPCLLRLRRRNDLIGPMPPLVGGLSNCSQSKKDAGDDFLHDAPITDYLLTRKTFRLSGY
jgi:hypothetical protein